MQRRLTRIAGLGEKYGGGLSSARRDLVAGGYCCGANRFFMFFLAFLGHSWGGGGQRLGAPLFEPQMFSSWQRQLSRVRQFHPLFQMAGGWSGDWSLSCRMLGRLLASSWPCVLEQVNVRGFLASLRLGCSDLGIPSFVAPPHFAGVGISEVWALRSHAFGLFARAFP